MKSRLTSYDEATVGMGAILNDCQYVYNDFGQLVIEYQSHVGAVNTGTSPKVQYAFADGSDNTIRPLKLTYPNGRELHSDYGSTDGIDDSASRVASLIDDVGTTHLVDYSYRGRRSFVETDYTEPETKYTLVGTAGGNDPDTGDIYRGLDRFGRIKDSYWYDYGASSDTDRIKYGYDRVGNRTYRENTVATTAGKEFDEQYLYDQIHRLKTMDRGTLNGSHTGLTSTTFGQCWTLDETGNWRGFREDDTGDGSWDLIQSRTANPVNEITDITESTGPSWFAPGYNRAGNMTTMPQPLALTSSYSATYDAWNRLVKLAAGADTVSEYAYDGAKRRIVQKSYTSGVLSETRHYYLTADWQTIEERLGTSPDSADAERQFVWGLRYIDDCILRDRDTNGNGTLDERLYALQDANWNVTGLIDPTGAVQERMAYTAYGVPLFLTSAFVPTSGSYDWDNLYCGYRYEPSTGLFHVRHRVLHPGLGIWVQRDPLGYHDGTNLYHLYYVLKLTDPYGEALTKCTQKECKDCVNSAINDDPIIEKIRDAMKGGKGKCKLSISCTECGPMDLGGYDTATGKIKLCWNSLKNRDDSPCGGVTETLRHELTHQLFACQMIPPGPKDPCLACICEEMNAYRVSGQCDDGSIWRTINPNFKDPQECIKKSAANSCTGLCGFVNSPQNVINRKINDAIRAGCTYIYDGKNKIIDLG